MNSALLQFIHDEVEKYDGVYAPVHVGFLHRHLVRKLPLNRLHPNPDDEFCSREVGPNEGIIARYVRSFQKKRVAMDMREFLPDGSFESDSSLNPIIVQKIHPDGYMILNGHHRWAAAHQLGMKTVRVCVVNLTQKNDIRKTLAASSNVRRATLDLDEVVLCGAANAPSEKPLRFPLNRFYPERVRLGIPALFHNLSRMKYDIWVYSAQYHSMDQITRLLGHHHAHIACAVTGTARKKARGPRMAEQLESMLSRKYTTTVHIDRNTVLSVSSGDKAFDEFRLSGSDDTWSREIIEYLERMDARAKD